MEPRPGSVKGLAEDERITRENGAPVLAGSSCHTPDGKVGDADVPPDPGTCCARRARPSTPSTMDAVRIPIFRAFSSPLDFTSNTAFGAFGVHRDRPGFDPTLATP